MHKKKTAGKAARPCSLTAAPNPKSYASFCPPRTVTETLDVFDTPFPIKEAQAVARALLAYEKAQMKRVTFTVTAGGDV